MFIRVTAYGFLLYVVGINSKVVWAHSPSSKYLRAFSVVITSISRLLTSGDILVPQPLLMQL
jgi:hypothetical protein